MPTVIVIPLADDFAFELYRALFPRNLTPTQRQQVNPVRKLTPTQADEPGIEMVTFTNWAKEEAQQNKVIVSTTPEGEDVVRCAMQSLEDARNPPTESEPPKPSSHLRLVK